MWGGGEVGVGCARCMQPACVRLHRGVPPCHPAPSASRLAAALPSPALLLPPLVLSPGALPILLPGAPPHPRWGGAATPVAADRMAVTPHQPARAGASHPPPAGPLKTGGCPSLGLLLSPRPGHPPPPPPPPPLPASARAPAHALTPPHAHPAATSHSRTYHQHAHPHTPPTHPPARPPARLRDAQAARTASTRPSS